MRTARTTIAALTATALAVGSLGSAVLAQDAAMAEPGQDVKVMLLPKFTDNQVFQQANEGPRKQLPSSVSRRPTSSARPPPTPARHRSPSSSTLRPRSTTCS